MNKTNITPTARNPGISLALCSHPMSTPEKLETSMTKLFKSATHVAKDKGIAMARKTKSQKGSLEKIFKERIL